MNRESSRSTRSPVSSGYRRNESGFFSAEDDAAYTEDDEPFGQVQLDAHKVGTIIKVSGELLNDSAFDLEGYIASEFVRRIGDKEEESYLTGNGASQPTGILNAMGGGEVGITAASATAITADELIDLYFSLKAPYRKNAIWLFNDTTVKLIRKLKDGNGQYLWQPSLRESDVPTILGRPYFTSAYMPAAEAKVKRCKETAEQEMKEYKQLQTWADLYQSCTFEAKKMIVSRFIKRLYVYRDYSAEHSLRSCRRQAPQSTPVPPFEAPPAFRPGRAPSR